MNLREEIARLTPGARRYARALVAVDSDERAETADHLVREAVARALRAEGTGLHSSLKIWLYVTINALNRTRLRNRAGTRTSSGEDCGAPTRPVAAAGGRGAGPAYALDRLACEEREALLLVVLEDLNYAQTCEILNIPRPTLIARLARARRTLAELTDPAHDQERSRRMPSPHLHIVK